MSRVTLAHFISTCLPRDRQKHNKVCNYMLKDSPLAPLELNRATALKFSEFFFSKKCRVMPHPFGYFSSVIPAQAGIQILCGAQSYLKSVFIFSGSRTSKG